MPRWIKGLFGGVVAALPLDVMYTLIIWTNANDRSFILISNTVSIAFERVKSAHTQSKISPFCPQPLVETINFFDNNWQAD